MLFDLLVFGGCQLGGEAAKGEQDKAKKKAVKNLAIITCRAACIRAIFLRNLLALACKAKWMPGNPIPDDLCLPRPRRRKESREAETAGIAGADMPNSISRHWPESSIKSSQANAGGGMLFTRNAQADGTARLLYARCWLETFNKIFRGIAENERQFYIEKYLLFLLPPSAAASGRLFPLLNLAGGRTALWKVKAYAGVSARGRSVTPPTERFFNVTCCCLQFAEAHQIFLRRGRGAGVQLPT